MELVGKRYFLWKIAEKTFDQVPNAGSEQKKTGQRDTENREHFGVAMGCPMPDPEIAHGAGRDCGARG